MSDSTVRVQQVIAAAADVAERDHEAMLTASAAAADRIRAEAGEPVDLDCLPGCSRDLHGVVPETPTCSVPGILIAGEGGDDLYQAELLRTFVAGGAERLIQLTVGSGDHRRDCGEPLGAYEARLLAAELIRFAEIAEADEITSGAETLGGAA